MSIILRILTKYIQKGWAIQLLVFTVDGLLSLSLLAGILISSKVDTNTLFKQTKTNLKPAVFSTFK
jgi:hypothetical protein